MLLFFKTSSLSFFFIFLILVNENGYPGLLTAMRVSIFVILFYSGNAPTFPVFYGVQSGRVVDDSFLHGVVI